ncbi:MAG: hypothetical protein ACYS47_11285 [Planctomycetota bacterium]|jgi:hypothetical protein
MNAFGVLLTFVFGIPIDAGASMHKGMNGGEPVSISGFMNPFPSLEECGLQQEESSPIETPYRMRFLPILDSEDYLWREPKKSGGFTALLSLLIPGTGHLYLGTDVSLVVGVIHILLDVTTIAVGVLGSQGGDGLNRIGAVIVVGTIMLIHRIECIIEGVAWCEVANQRRLRNPDLSPCYLPDEKAFGACMSYRF